jgi:hypothetical protein
VVNIKIMVYGDPEVGEGIFLLKFGILIVTYGYLM